MQSTTEFWQNLLAEKRNWSCWRQTDTQTHREGWGKQSVSPLSAQEIILSFAMRTAGGGVGEMAHWLECLLLWQRPWDQVPASTEQLTIGSRGCDACLWPPRAPGTHVVIHMYNACRQLGISYSVKPWLLFSTHTPCAKSGLFSSRTWVPVSIQLTPQFNKQKGIQIPVEQQSAKPD